MLVYLLRRKINVGLCLNVSETVSSMVTFAIRLKKLRANLDDLDFIEGQSGGK